VTKVNQSESILTVQHELI